MICGLGQTRDTTPTGPARPDDTKAQRPPGRAERVDVERLRRAAVLAKALYPGPVGELVNRELRAWDEFGYRFGGGSIQRLVDHLLEKADQPADG